MLTWLDDYFGPLCRYGKTGNRLVRMHVLEKSCLNDVVDRWEVLHDQVTFPAT